MEYLFTNVDLHFSVFTFKIIAEEFLQLPEFKGSTFRGGMGTGLAELCRKRSLNFDCASCRENSRCPYAALFSNPRTAVEKAPLDAQNLPHPFVLRPPLTERETFAPGQTLECHLILFGRYAAYLPFYIYAFELFSEYGIGKARGRFLLAQILDAFTGKEIYSHVDKSPTSNFTVMSLSRIISMQLPWPSSSIALDFVTPTRIIDDNKSSIDISFSLLIRSLLRRASTLADLYDGKKWQLDFSNIIKKAEKSVPIHKVKLYSANWEKYSRSQNSRVPMEGFRGQVCYRGEIQPFLPLIRLGHYMHIGSKTTHGMGQYEIRDL